MTDFETPNWSEDIKKAAQDIKAVGGFFRALAGYFGISFDLEKEGYVIGRFTGYLRELASQVEEGSAQGSIIKAIAAYFVDNAAYFVDNPTNTDSSQGYNLETINFLCERNRIIANQPLPDTVDKTLAEVAVRTEFIRQFTKANFPLESLMAMSLYWPSFRRNPPVESVS